MPLLSSYFLSCTIIVSTGFLCFMVQWCWTSYAWSKNNHAPVTSSNMNCRVTAFHGHWLNCFYIDHYMFQYILLYMILSTSTPVFLLDTLLLNYNYKLKFLLKFVHFMTSFSFLADLLIGHKCTWKMFCIHVYDTRTDLIGTHSM